MRVTNEISAVKQELLSVHKLNKSCRCTILVRNQNKNILFRSCLLFPKSVYIGLVVNGKYKFEEPISTTDISRMISLYSGGQIYKLASTLKDSLEHRLKREGYVEGLNLNNKSLYSITPKGKKLLEGWLAFLEAFA